MQADGWMHIEYPGGLCIYKCQKDFVGHYVITQFIVAMN